MIVALIALLAPGLGGVARSQGGTSTETPRKTFTISGTVGLPGVKFKGLPGDPVSDDQGGFSIEVPNDLNGYVMPIKEGYAFDPPFVAFGPTSRIDTVYFTPRVLPFTLSGNVGLPGVAMKGLPVEVHSKPDGSYRVLVEFGWSGTVTPAREGYWFEPAERVYAQVTADHGNQNYKAQRITFEISGSVGLPGVVMKGFPVSVVTDSDGRYVTLVEYGWSGTVTPEKEGYAFTPVFREFRKVVSSQTNQDYTGDLMTFTISGNAGAPGVLMRGLPGDPVTDEKGLYRVQVDHGWSGVVVPYREDFNFTPPMREYTPVRGNQNSEDFAAKPRGLPQAGAPSSTGGVLVVPMRDTAPERIAETMEDMRVMLRILKDKLNEPRMILGVLRDYGSFFDEGRTVEALYLQGTAVVFIVQVDFPYSFPAQQPTEGETQQEPADPVWEQARQKLRSPPGLRTLGARAQTPRMTFDQFKDELLRSLKHAANLRNIDPNEQIILTVVAQNEGASRAGDADAMRLYREVYGSDFAATVGAGRRVPSTTVLTMQARKADIDAFARGELDFGPFRQMVRSFTY
jgi:hypothetical protein